MTQVLFIGGYGRSGSTLADRLIGRVDGVCSAGELRHIWREGFAENRRCGCGAAFRSCPFWNDVMDVAYGGLSAVDTDAVLDLQRRVDRWWLVPRIARRARGGDTAWRAQLAAYLDVLGRLYHGIATVSGCDVVVDSSKDVSHGYLLTALSSAGRADPFEVAVVHLVRDPRAVAYSWHHRAKDDPGTGGAMNRYGLLRIGLEWNVINALASGLRARADRYLTLRYDDLVRDPEAAVATVLDLVGRAQAAPSVAEGREIVLGEDHLVAGNPIRFTRGPITVRPDERWRSAMPARERALVTSLTAPGRAMLRLHGGTQ